MITKKHIYFLFLSIFALSSCEKVIDVDLKDSEPRIVIEGQINSETGLNLISLSKSSSFYSSEPIEKIVDAIVEVSDEIGNKYILDEFSPGLYNNKDLKVKSNHEYKLQVKTETDIMESYSKTSSPVKIDSINIELSQFSNSDEPDELSYKIITYFLDNVDEVNYYRLRLVINGEYMSGFYITNDNFTNGKTISYNFNGTVLEDQDEVWVELMGIDEANYNYYYTLQRLIGNGQDITPGNPPTNIEGDAIGIFCASTYDSMIKDFYIDELTN